MTTGPLAAELVTQVARHQQLPEEAAALAPQRSRRLAGELVVGLLDQRGVERDLALGHRRVVR